VEPLRHFGKCPNKSGNLLGVFPPYIQMFPLEIRGGKISEKKLSVDLAYRLLSSHKSGIFCQFLSRAVVLLDLIKLKEVL
jgi:hypothetical protein